MRLIIRLGRALGRRVGSALDRGFWREFKAVLDLWYSQLQQW